MLFYLDCSDMVQVAVNSLTPLRTVASSPYWFHISSNQENLVLTVKNRLMQNYCTTSANKR